MPSLLDCKGGKEAGVVEDGDYFLDLALGDSSYACAGEFDHSISGFNAVEGGFVDSGEGVEETDSTSFCEDFVDVHLLSGEGREEEVYRLLIGFWADEGVLDAWHVVAEIGGQDFVHNLPVFLVPDFIDESSH